MTNINKTTTGTHILERYPISKLLRIYATPAILNMLVVALYNVVDRIFVGQGAGPMAICGLALTLPCLALFSTVGTLTGVGAAAQIMNATANNDLHKAKQILGINNAVYQSNDNLMKQFGGGKEDEELYKLRITRAFLSGTLLHNTIISLNRCHHGIFDKIVRIYDKFNVPAAEFIGYWSKKAPKVVQGKEVYASVYKHPTENKLLAVISHIGNQRLDQEVVVRFAPEVLGMKNFKIARELLEADDPEYAELYKLRKANDLPIVRIQLKWQNPGIKLVEFKNNTVKLKLPAHSFAIVELQ